MPLKYGLSSMFSSSIVADPRGAAKTNHSMRNIQENVFSIFRFCYFMSFFPTLLFGHSGEFYEKFTTKMNANVARV